MISFPDYRKATNAAYEVLYEFCDDYPKINIFSIIKSFNYIKIHTYSEAASKINTNLNKFINQYAASNHGYTHSDHKGHYLIFFNDTKDEKTIRFTLAHELGHIILDHNGVNPYNEKEADCFARNILCPIPIIRSYGISTPADYVNCFGISKPMAEIAFRYAKSDMYYITKNNYQLLNKKIYSYF